MCGKYRFPFSSNNLGRLRYSTQEILMVPLKDTWLVKFRWCKTMCFLSTHQHFLCHFVYILVWSKIFFLDIVSQNHVRASACRLHLIPRSKKQVNTISYFSWNRELLYIRFETRVWFYIQTENQFYYDLYIVTFSIS